jgi:hypothetical protein
VPQNALFITPRGLQPALARARAERKAVRITPLDFEDSLSRWNGRQIEQRTDLEELLEESRRRKPFLLELSGSNGFKLIIGIGGSAGCVQYSSTDGAPPYLVAVARPELEAAGEMEFLAGGTAAPIPARHCLPFELVKKAVFHFFEQGGRITEVEWEEV